MPGQGNMFIRSTLKCFLFGYHHEAGDDDDDEVGDDGDCGDCGDGGFNSIPFLLFLNCFN